MEKVIILWEKNKCFYMGPYSPTFFDQLPPLNCETSSIVKIREMYPT